VASKELERFLEKILAFLGSSHYSGLEALEVVASSTNEHVLKCRPLADTDTDTYRSYRFDLLVVADGARSDLRSQLQLRHTLQTLIRFPPLDDWTKQDSVWLGPSTFTTTAHTAALEEISHTQQWLEMRANTSSPLSGLKDRISSISELPPSFLLHVPDLHQTTVIATFVPDEAGIRAIIYVCSVTDPDALEFRSLSSASLQ
jgi:2-polyprenyl-6-methoxyphenol hydroxylase-like FAD-dependent oxidoreductase